MGGIVKSEKKEKSHYVLTKGNEIAPPENI
jgi:hypothetical protein